MVKLVEVEPGRWRVERVSQKPARSDLPLPYVISDIMDPTEQVDGRFYTSKRAYRAVGRAMGLIEVGNEKLKPKPKGVAHLGREQEEKRRESIQKSIARYRSGERVKVS